MSQVEIERLNTVVINAAKTLVRLRMQNRPLADITAAYNELESKVRLLTAEENKSLGI